MNAPIKKLRVRDYQGVREAVIGMGPLTFLFGSNEAGKTSLAEALGFVVAPDDKPANRRFKTLPESVRQGAKKAEVEVTTADDTVFAREQGKTGAGGRKVNGVPSGEDVFNEAIGAKFGVSGEVLSAALRSGSLLDRDPQALLDMLLAVCGGEIGQEVIATELALVKDQLAELNLPMPSTMAHMSTTAANAIEIRKTGKARHKTLDGDLSRLPVVDLALRQEAENMDALSIDDERRDLNDRKAKAVAAKALATGRSEERRAHIRAAIATNEAVPKVDACETAAQEKVVEENKRTVRNLESEIAVAKSKRGFAKDAADAGPCALPEGHDTIAAAIAASLKEATKAHRDVGNARMGASWALKAVDAMREGKCSTCHRDVTPEEASAAHDVYVGAQKIVERAEGELNRAHKEWNRLTAEGKRVDVIKTRIAARQEEVRFDEQIAGLEARYATAKALTEGNAHKVQELLTQNYEAKKHADAQKALVDLRKALAEAEQPAEEPEDVGAIDDRLKRLDVIAGALGSIQRGEDIRSNMERALAVADIADRVAEECGPSGAQARLVAKAIRPFLSAANAMLSRFAEGYAVALATENGPRLVARREGVTLEPKALSDGRRTSLLYILQLALAKLAHAPLVVFDRVELIDKAGKKILGELATEAAESGIQVLFLTSEAAPAVCPAGITMYEVSNGTARHIPWAKGAV